MKRKNFYLILLLHLLLFPFFNKVSAQNILDRKVSLEINEADIKLILKAIEEQAKVKFAYSTEVAQSAILNLKINNKPLSEVLDLLFNKEVVYETVGKIIVLRKKNDKNSLAPVIGVVTDETANILPGVSIILKGTSIGTSTDRNGNFELKVPDANGVLVFSSLGFVSQEIPIGSRPKLDVSLNTSLKGLDEVVVVGYGNQKRINVTGSVSTIGREEIQQTPSASLQNVLIGKMPGFYSQQRGGQPGRDGADFFVRGVSTFNGNQSPLILVDDIEFNYEDFSTIDPNDIQSLSILKDASTTAIYGIKGANGVILITTRRGLAGIPKINFKTELGLQMPTHVPRFLDAATTAELRNEALINEGLKPQFTDNDIELYRNGTDPYGHPNINWYDQLFKKAAIMGNNNLDLSGGSDNVRYFASVGYLDQQGMLKNIRSKDDIDNNYKYNRVNLRSNVDIKATKSLSFKLDFSGNKSTVISPKFAGVSGSGETAAFYEVLNYESLNPYIYNIYNPDGSYGYANPNSTQPSGNANNIIGRIAYGGYTRVQKNLLNLNVSAIQKLTILTEGLEARLLASVSNSNAALKSLNRINFPSYYYNPSTNTYISRDASIYRIDPYTLIYEPGMPNRQSTLQASLRYQRSFSGNNINALVLYNQNTKVLPHVLNDTEQYDSYIPVNFRGYTARINYNLHQTYLLELNGSYNGTTRFDANHRYGFFPAVSAGWNIAEENFIKHNFKGITQLKIRGSYGIAGSDDLGNFNNTYLDSYLRSGSYSFGVSPNSINTIVPGTIGNPNVTWEKEQKTDIGLDVSFFNGKVSGIFDAFWNKRYDILTQRQTIPSYFGLQVASLPPQNIGKVSNRGYEFELNYNAKIGREFRFNIKGNYSFARNKILEIDEVVQKFPWKTQTGQSIGAIPEWIWDGFYSIAEAADPSVPKYIGSSTTTPGFLKYRDINGDGVISTDDMGYFGKPNLPNTILGLSTGFNFRQISFNLLLQSALNYDVQVGYQFATPFKANLQEIHLKRWTPETASVARFPSLVTNFHGTYMSSGSNSSFWSISGNYLRVKSVEISYRIPERLIKKAGLRGLRVYANGYNLITWSKTFERYGLDPEVARSGGSSTTNGIYPQQAIFNLGFSVSVK